MPHSPVFDQILPVEIVYHPSWWNKHTGIIFDEDFFFHPLKRVESEQHMEKELYERFGNYGLGTNHNTARPEIGAVHNAAGFMLSEMLGCEVRYREDSAPAVVPLYDDRLIIDPDRAFKSPVFQKFRNMCEDLKKSHGFLTGDVNWGGVLNLALDVRGNDVFMDLMLQPDSIKSYFNDIASVIETFVEGMQKETGTSSISVNRQVGRFKKPIFLHSECTHTMIAEDQYDEFLLPIDIAWSKRQQPFGIHYCGPDPHRFASSFKKVPRLDFLDVGWGGDLRILREALPDTFLNIRLDPVSIAHKTTEEIQHTIRTLVNDAGNPYLTGVCCINMDHQVGDEVVETILKTVQEIRTEILNPA